MDFAKINTAAACQTVRTVIVEVDGVPTDIEVDVIGADSPQARRANAAVRAKLPPLEARRAQLHERLKKLAAGTAEAEQIIDALAKIDADINAAWCRYMAECTVAWRNIEADGVPVPFSVETAEQFYAQSQPLQATVMPAVWDRAGFLGNVPTNGGSSSKPKRG